MPNNIYKQAQPPSQQMAQPLQEAPVIKGLESTGVEAPRPFGWKPDPNIFRPARIEDIGRSNEDFADNMGGIWNGVIQGVGAVSAVPAFFHDLGSKDVEDAWIDSISNTMDEWKEDYGYTPYYHGQESEYSMNPFSEKYSSSYSLGELGHFLGFVLPTIPVALGVAAAAPEIGIGVGATAMITGAATMLGMGYQSGYEAAKEAGLDSRDRLTFAKYYGGGMAVIGAALPAGLGKVAGGKTLTGLAPGLIPKSVLRKLQQGSTQEAIKAIRQFQGKGSGVGVISEMVAAAQKGNARNIYNNLIKNAKTFGKESANSGGMLMGFTAYDYLTKAISDVIVDDIEEYKNTNRGKFGIEFTDVEDWKQGAKDMVSSGLFGFVGHGYNSMMMKGIINPAARKAVGVESFSDYYKKQGKGLVGSEFENIKALELRSIVQRSIDPKTGAINSKKYNKLVENYGKGLDKLIETGKFTQEEGHNIKVNSERMLSLFRKNPTMNTNAFMQTWRLDGLDKTIKNIYKQNRDIIDPRKGKKTTPNIELAKKFRDTLIEINNSKELLLKKGGGNLKSVDLERLETLIKDLSESLPENQKNYISNYMSDILIGSKKVSVIDAFKDIQNKDFIKKISGYISNSKVSNMWKDFSNTNISSKLIKADVKFKPETAKEIQSKLRDKKFNPADALDYAESVDQGKAILDLILKDGRLIDSEFEFKDKLEADLKSQFDTEPNNLQGAIANVKKKIKEPESLYSAYKSGSIHELKGLDDKFMEILASGEHAGLSQEQIRLAGEEFKKLRQEPTYLEEVEGHAGAEPIFTALDKALKTTGSKSGLSYRQISDIAEVMNEKGQLSDSAVQKIKDISGGELLDKKLTPELLGEFDKIVSDDLGETAAIFRTRHNKHISNFKNKREFLKSFKKNEETIESIANMDIFKFGEKYKEQLSSLGYKSDEVYDMSIVDKAIKTAKENDLGAAEFVSHLDLESYLVDKNTVGILEELRDSYRQKVELVGTPKEMDILRELGKEMTEMAETPEGKVPSIEVTKEIYDKFVDTGEVPKGVLENIAEKYKEKKSELSIEEQAIFSNKTAEIEKILAEDVTPKGQAFEPGEVPKHISEHDVDTNKGARGYEEIRAFTYDPAAGGKGYKKVWGNEIDLGIPELKDIEAYVYKGIDGKYIIIDKPSGLSFPGGSHKTISETKKFAVNKLKEQIESRGIDEVKKVFKEAGDIYKEPPTEAPKEVDKYIDKIKEAKIGETVSTKDNVYEYEKIGEDKWRENVLNETFTTEEIINEALDYYSYEKEAPKEVDLGEYVNHSGGAKGSDTAWDVIGQKHGMVKNKHYYHGKKTAKGNTPITEEQLNEGWEKVLLANKTLNRKPENYKSLLSRNWQQVKNADEVFAIGKLKHPKSTEVEGGTGWAVQMAVDAKKPVNVFDINTNKWYRIDKTLSERPIELAEAPVLTKNFAGIGTRNITEAGKKAIEDVYNKSKGTAEAPKGEDVHSLLGDVTESGNVQIVDKPWSQKDGIVAMRAKGEEHWGNPFGSEETTARSKFGLVNVGSVKNAVIAFTEWAQGEKRFSSVKDTNGNLIDLTTIDPKRRAWIAKEIQSGKHKDKQIYYYKELNEPSHATALDYLINSVQQVEKVTKEEFLKRQPTTEAPTTTIPIGDKVSGKEGPYLMSDHYNEFRTQVADLLGLKVSTPDIIVDAMGYLYKMNNFSNNIEVRNLTAKIISAANWYRSQKKNVDSGFKFSPEKKAELAKNYKTLAELSLKDSNILKEVKINEKNIEKFLKDEFAEEIKDTGQLGYKGRAFKEMLDISDASLMDSYINMFDSGFRIYNKKTGEAYWKSQWQDIPSGEFMSQYFKYKTMLNERSRTFRNIKEMLDFDLKFKTGTGKKLLEELGFGNKASLGEFEPYNHLWSQAALRWRDLLKNTDLSLLKNKIKKGGDIRLEHITPNVLKYLVEAVAKNAVFQSAKILEKFGKGDSISQYSKYNKKEGSLKPFIDKYEIGFKSTEISTVTGEPMVFNITTNELLNIINDIRSPLISTEYSGKFNPEFSDLITNFSEIGRSTKKITKAELERMPASIGHVIKARLEEYSNYYDINRNAEGELEFSIKENPEFLAPSKLLYSLHYEEWSPGHPKKGRYNIPLPEYEGVPSTTKTINDFNKWVRFTNPNQEAINAIDKLIADHHNRDISSIDMIDVIQTQQMSAEPVVRSMNFLIDYMKKADYIEADQVKAVKNNPLELENLLADFGVLENFAREKINYKDWKEFIKESNWEKNLSTEGQEFIKKLAKEHLGHKVRSKKVKQVEEEIIDNIYNIIKAKSKAVSTIERLDLEDPVNVNDVRLLGGPEAKDAKITIEYLNKIKGMLREEFYLQNITSKAHIERLADNYHYKIEEELFSGLTSLDNTTLEFYGYGKRNRFRDLGKANDFLDYVDVKPKHYRQLLLDIIRNPEEVEFEYKDKYSENFFDKINNVRNELGLHEKESISEIERKIYDHNGNIKLEWAKKIDDYFTKKEFEYNKEKDINDLVYDGSTFLLKWLKEKKQKISAQKYPKTFQTTPENKTHVKSLIGWITHLIKGKNNNDARIIVQKNLFSETERHYLEKGRSVSLNFFGTEKANFYVKNKTNAKDILIEEPWNKLKESYGEEYIESVKRAPEAFVILDIKTLSLETPSYKIGESRKEQQLGLLGVKEGQMGSFFVKDNTNSSYMFFEKFKNEFGLPKNVEESISKGELKLEDAGEIMKQRIMELLPYAKAYKLKSFNNKIYSIENRVKELNNKIIEIRLNSSDKDGIEMARYEDSIIKYRKRIINSPYNRREQIKDKVLGRMQEEAQGFIRKEGKLIGDASDATMKFIKTIKERDTYESELTRLRAYRAFADISHTELKDAARMYINDFKRGYKAFLNESIYEKTLDKDFVMLTDKEAGFDYIRRTLQRDLDKGIAIPKEGEDIKLVNFVKANYERVYGVERSLDRMSLRDLDEVIANINDQFNKPLAESKIEGISEKNAAGESNITIITDENTRQQIKDAYGISESEARELDGRYEKGEIDDFENPATAWIEGDRFGVLDLRNVTEKIREADLPKINKNKKILTESEVFKKRKLELGVKGDHAEIINSLGYFDRFSASKKQKTIKDQSENIENINKQIKNLRPKTILAGKSNIKIKEKAIREIRDLTKKREALIQETAKEIVEEPTLNGLTKKEYIEALVNATADHRTNNSGMIPIIRNHEIAIRAREGEISYMPVQNIENFLTALQNINPRYNPEFQLINGKPFKEFLKEQDVKFYGSSATIANYSKGITYYNRKAPKTPNDLSKLYDGIIKDVKRDAEINKERSNLDSSMDLSPKGQGYGERFFQNINENPEAFNKIVDILKKTQPHIELIPRDQVIHYGIKHKTGEEIKHKGLAYGKHEGKIIVAQKGDIATLEDGSTINLNQTKAIIKAIEYSTSDATLDTIPHEYSHHYVDMFRNDPLIKNALKEIFSETGKKGGEAKEELSTKLGKDFVAEVLRIKRNETTLNESLGKKWFKWAYDFYDMVKGLFSSNPLKSEYDKLFDAFKQGYSPEERAANHLKEQTKRFLKGERDQFKHLGFGYKNNLEEVDPLDDTNIIKPKVAAFKNPKDIPLHSYKVGDEIVYYAEKKLGYTKDQIDILKNFKQTGKGDALTIKKLKDQYISKLYEDNLADKFLYSEVEGGIKLDKKITSEIDYVLSKLGDMDPGLQKLFMNTHFSSYSGYTNHAYNILKFIGGSENTHLFNSVFGELSEGKRTAQGLNSITKNNFSEALNSNYSKSSERAGIEYGADKMKIIDGKSNKDGEVSGKATTVDNNRKILLTNSELAQIYRTIKSLESSKSQVQMQTGEKGSLDPNSGIVFKVFGRDNVENRKANDSFRLTKNEIDNINRAVEGSQDIMSLVLASENSSKTIGEKIMPIYKKLKGIELDELKEYITVVREVENTPIENLEEIVLESFFKQRKSDAKNPVLIRGIMKNAVDYNVSAMRFAESKIGNHNLKQLIRILHEHKSTSPFLTEIKKNLLPKLEELSEYYSGTSIKNKLASDKNLADKFMDNFPIYALGYNPFVSLKQSVSYIMASPEINKKYFRIGDFMNIANVSRKGFAKWFKTGGNKELTYLDPYLKELYENSPGFQERLQGRLFKEIYESIDTSLNPITGQDIYSGIHLAGKKFRTNKYIRKTRAMEWIPIVDSATIAQIYKCCKLELKDQGLEGKELINAAVRKTEFITNKTQPTFDRLWSSSFRDSKNLVMRGLSMFGAQPHKNYNYALEAMFDYYVNDRKVYKNKLKKAMASAFILQPLALAALGIPSLLATSVFDIDDGKTYMAALKDAVRRSVGTIPGGKAVAGLSSAALGGGKRDVVGIHPISSVGLDVMNLFDDNYYAKNNQYERMGRVASSLGGLPGFPIKHTASILD